MKILHIVTAYPRVSGDPITPWLVDLIEAQCSLGLDPEVLAPAYRGRTAAGPGSVPVHRFRYAPSSLETLTHDETVPERLGRKPAYAALLGPYMAAGLGAAIRLGKRDYDVAHVHWPMPHALFGAALRASSGGRTAVVCSFYSVEINWVRRRLPALTPFLRWSIETADAVTAISTSTARAVREVTQRDVTVVPFAAAVAPNPALDTPPPLGRTPLRLLFVGRLVERKGVEVLVRALRIVREACDAKLTVVGTGAWEPQIRAEVQRQEMGEHVRFAGSVSNEELIALYARCDIFALPAVVDRKGDTEGLGVVLLEALAFGRPVVASDVGGIPDIVEPGRTGWLVPPGDPGALARTLLEIDADVDGSRQIAEAGRRSVGERFSVERIAAQTAEVYAAAVDRCRGSDAARGGRGG